MGRRLVVGILLLPGAAAQAAMPYRAIAKIRGATGVDAQVSGSVVFEQLTPLGDVTVRVDIRGLRPGKHGFHVHQFGDVRSTSDLSTMSAHFVPFCAPPSIDENGQQTGGCENDQVHGFPPSARRQPGDMGNITVRPNGTVEARAVVESRDLADGRFELSYMST